jgi:hypothetical protein
MSPSPSAWERLLPAGYLLDASASAIRASSSFLGDQGVDQGPHGRDERGGWRS